MEVVDRAHGLHLDDHPLVDQEVEHVRALEHAQALAERSSRFCCEVPGRHVQRTGLQEAIACLVCTQQGFNLAAQFGVTRARVVEKRRPGGGVPIERSLKNPLDLLPALRSHRLNSRVSQALALANLAPQCR